jgi:glycosyltransferase involved in cell wall biosynthesis
MSDGPSLCLNMIVKNEMQNLPRCLGSLVDHIACWVIGDTGSSDGTPDFIKSFFASRNVPGELHQFPFENFEQARNEALARSVSSPLIYDYQLFADADMELVVDDPGFRTRLKAPAYLVLQRTESGFSYWNTRLVQRHAGARYHGVTHEYVDLAGEQQNLEGVWYKDHASGSNRVDKLERDIALLSAALKKEPENARYWFYLAQTYRDCGRIAEAAMTYAKRAVMGGWAEEAWHARLEEARMFRCLGEDSTFLRQALAAFNERPQRAEPLYDLARFYRERGMNHTSVLFSEAGLALRKPAAEILFLEDSVYDSGLLEEYSIAAYYSPDSARKERGRLACDWLALSRNVPPASRNLARSNATFYTESAESIMPSFSSKEVAFIVPADHCPLSLSIAKRDGDLFLLQCSTGIPSERSADMRSKFQLKNVRTLLLQLNTDLELQSAKEVMIAPSALSSSELGGSELANARLLVWRDDFWCLAEIDLASNREQLLAQLECASPVCQTDYQILRPRGTLTRLGWIPRVSGDNLHFITQCDPTRVIDEQARIIFEGASAFAAEQFIGRTQAIPFDEGWLALIDEVKMSDTSQFNQHRLIWFDEQNVLRSVSRRFFFQEKETELVSGLAWHPDGKILLFTYSVGQKSWVAVVSAAEVRGLIRTPQQLRSELFSSATMKSL